MNKAFKGEYIACSAIYYPHDVVYNAQPKNIESGFVSLGHRHFNCREQLVHRFYPNWESEFTKPTEEQVRVKVLRSEIQGFLTNTNRFVDREEALSIALNADQILENREHGLTDELFSEDIY